jgi:hypothetical protein
MWRSVCLAVGLVAAAWAGASAQSGGSPPAPRFSLADEVVIARNDMLNALLSVDPWGVRKILDELAELKQRAPPPDAGRHRDVTGPGAAKGAVRVDPVQNPDLNLLFQRSSPEAAYDLFQILKQVGSKPAGAN